MLRTEVGCPARRGEEREREGGGVVAGVLGRRRGRRREVTMREREGERGQLVYGWRENSPRMRVGKVVSAKC
jgi:hypothetical protein